VLVGVRAGEVADRVALEQRRRHAVNLSVTRLARLGERQQVARVVRAEVGRAALPTQSPVVARRHQTTAPQPFENDERPPVC